MLILPGAGFMYTLFNSRVPDAVQNVTIIHVVNKMLQKYMS